MELVEADLDSDVIPLPSIPAVSVCGRKYQSAGIRCATEQPTTLAGMGGFEEIEFTLEEADPIAVEVRGDSMLPVFAWLFLVFRFFDVLVVQSLELVTQKHVYPLEHHN